MAPQLAAQWCNAVLVPQFEAREQALTHGQHRDPAAHRAGLRRVHQAVVGHPRSVRRDGRGRHGGDRARRSPAADGRQPAAGWDVPGGGGVRRRCARLVAAAPAVAAVTAGVPPCRAMPDDRADRSAGAGTTRPRRAPPSLADRTDRHGEPTARHRGRLPADAVRADAGRRCADRPATRSAGGLCSTGTRQPTVPPTDRRRAGQRHGPGDRSQARHPPQPRRLGQPRPRPRPDHQPRARQEGHLHG